MGLGKLAQNDVVRRCRREFVGDDALRRLRDLRALEREERGHDTYGRVVGSSATKTLLAAPGALRIDARGRQLAASLTTHAGAISSRLHSGANVRDRSTSRLAGDALGSERDAVRGQRLRRGRTQSAAHLGRIDGVSSQS